MQVVTRSKARHWESPDLVALPRDGEGNHPRVIAESVQGNAIVVGHEEVGRPSSTFPAAITCHTQNEINLFSCDQWNVRYVGETTLALHKKINLDRRLNIDASML